MQIGNRYARAAMAVALGLSLFVVSQASANIQPNPIINGCEHSYNYAANHCTTSSGWNISGTGSNTFSVIATASGTMQARLFCANPNGGYDVVGASTYSAPIRTSYACPVLTVNYQERPAGSVCGPAMNCASDPL